MCKNTVCRGEHSCYNKRTLVLCRKKRGQRCVHGDSVASKKSHVQPSGSDSPDCSADHRAAADDDGGDGRHHDGDHRRRGDGVRRFPGGQHQYLDYPHLLRSLHRRRRGGLPVSWPPGHGKRQYRCQTAALPWHFGGEPDGCGFDVSSAHSPPCIRQ